MPKAELDRLLGAEGGLVEGLRGREEVRVTVKELLEVPLMEGRVLCEFRGRVAVLYRDEEAS